MSGIVHGGGVIPADGECHHLGLGPDLLFQQAEVPRDGLQTLRQRRLVHREELRCGEASAGHPDRQAPGEHGDIPGHPRQCHPGRVHVESDVGKRELPESAQCREVSYINCSLAHSKNRHYQGRGVGEKLPEPGEGRAGAGLPGGAAAGPAEGGEGEM